MLNTYRYKRRGIDDDGHVANYVETEQILSFGEHQMAFFQVRGSVPVVRIHLLNWNARNEAEEQIFDIAFSSIGVNQDTNIDHHQELIGVRIQLLTLIHFYLS